MEFKDLESIVECLKKWDQIRDNSSAVINYLSTGNSFKLNRNKPTAENLHAYPGIDTDGELYFFIIDAAADLSGNPVDLYNSITACKVQSSLGNGDEIPEIVARKRMNNWSKNYAQWATDQISMEQQTQGIFKAFNIPAAYAVQNTDYTVFFGLKDSGSVTGYDADLITIDSSKSTTVFYDTVRPVPPFDATMPESSFYLLSLV